MPELASRDDVEATIAAMLLRVNERQRNVLYEYMGWPPNPALVPKSVIEQLEKEAADEMYGIMGTLFVMSASQFADELDFSVRRSDLIDRAHDWAKVQATTVASSTLGTKLDRLGKLAANVPPGLPRARLWRPGMDEPVFTPGTSASDLEGLAGAEEVEVIDPYKQFEQDVLDVFNESSAKTVAKTEVTQATTAGEKSVAGGYTKATGKILEAFWRHRAPKDGQRHPCKKICQPLENQPSVKWPDIHPLLPHLWLGPPGHPNCDCNMEWVELSPEEAAAYGIKF